MFRFLLILFISINIFSSGDIGLPVRVSEGDGTPDAYANHLEFTDGSVTIDSGKATISASSEKSIYVKPGDDIQTAIDTLNGNGTIYLLPGTYTITSQINIDEDYVTIQGYGWSTKIIGSGEAASINHGFNITGDNVTIKDLWFDGNSISVNYCFVFHDCSYGRVEGCKVGHSRTDGIVFGPNFDKGWILNNYCYENNNPDDSGDFCSGIEIEDGSTNILVDGNIVYDCKGGVFPHTHPTYNPCSNITITNNILIGGTGGDSRIYIQDAESSAYSENYVISGNQHFGGSWIWIDGYVKDLVIDDFTIIDGDGSSNIGVITVEGDVTDVTISNGIINGSADNTIHGIKIEGDNTSVSDVIIKNVDFNCVHIDTTADGAKIIGVTGYNSGVTEYGYGVDVRGPNAYVADCKFYNESGITTQNVGIRVRSGGDNTTVVNNQLSNLTIGLWFDSGADNLTVAENSMSSVSTEYNDSGGTFLNSYFYGGVEATDFITGKKAGIFAYLGASANTTITTAGTYYPIQGTFTNLPIESFGAATTYTPGIKYTGSLTQYFKIDYCAEVSASVVNTDVTIAIYKNGTLCSCSPMTTRCFTAGAPYAIAGIVVVELAENDEIQLMVTSDGSGDVITFENFQTTINEFFD